MPLTLPSAADFAADLATELAALDPDGFGSLSADNQARIQAKLFTAIATVTLAAIEQGITTATVSVSGTTASACTAGGAAGTCTATGSLS